MKPELRTLTPLCPNSLELVALGFRELVAVSTRSGGVHTRAIIRTNRIKRFNDRAEFCNLFVFWDFVSHFFLLQTEEKPYHNFALNTNP